MTINTAEVFDSELKMTVGCTDPGAVAYAAAKASSLLDGELSGLDILLSRSIYKNAVCVGIPGIKKNGIEYAALLGAMVRKPELKLAVLGAVNEAMLGQLEEAVKKIPVTVACIDCEEVLYIRVACQSSTSVSKVVISGDYDRISSVEKDNECLYRQDPVIKNPSASYEGWDLKSIWDAALSGETDYGPLINYEAINKKAGGILTGAEKENPVHGLVNGKSLCTGEMAALARIYVLNTGKRRMSGEVVPVVSVAGSGNLGILSMLAVSAVCDFLGISQEERGKALCLSVLITIYIKNQMNRLTVMCGTALAGAAGAASAIAYLLGGGLPEIEMAINTILGSIGGLLCDGAKESCAFKVGFAAELAVVSGAMAADCKGIKPGGGIITHEIDKNIRNVGHINNKGMREVDNIILEILHTQKKTGRL